MCNCVAVFTVILTLIYRPKNANNVEDFVPYDLKIIFIKLLHTHACGGWGSANQ